MKLVEIKEGKTRFLIPEQEEGHNFPPGSAPVFFNKRMAINRDLTVLLLKCIEPETYLDAMGATGARGLRVFNECGIKATICDKDNDAISLIKYNRDSCCKDVEVVECDVNVLMHQRRFDAVDIDPFGSPAPFINSAATSAKKYLFLTATDTAPLCGAHQKAGIRRYFSKPLNNEYHSETGLRVLLGYAARECAKYDRGTEPLFCYAREHFVRVHLKVTGGAGRADKALDNLGYVHHCSKCGFRTEQKGILPETIHCSECGNKLAISGPVWLGAVSNNELLREMLDKLPEAELDNERAIEKLLSVCMGELDTSTFYDYHVMSRLWKVSPRSIDKVIESLNEKGYKASRVHYCGTGIKTNAPLDAIKESLT
ncbi:MAG: tRNA (guanine(10)-N(2))-dimethyltransferase [Methanomicrobiaceae archaeon]|nr:tRNA (guanine(10)-N(2))-dimethyltransferase [Methanomicrobiaceae archaeon]